MSKATIEATQDHLHPAMTHVLDASMWLHKTISGVAYGTNIRQTLEFARSNLRDCLAELDAFEAKVWPALASAEDLSEHERLKQAAGVSS